MAKRRGKTLTLIRSQLAAQHSSLTDFVNSIPLSCCPGSPNRVCIELAKFEELGLFCSQLQQTDSELETLLSNSKTLLHKAAQGTSQLQREIQGIKQLLPNYTKEVKTLARQASLILTEYKERCRGSFLNYLKNIDSDLRKILAPLVPSSVLKQAVQYPPINEALRLYSSVAHSRDPSMELRALPPTKGPVKKLNAHIQMLATTLEGVAKELLSVLLEGNKQYFELLNRTDTAHAPTPLAAPLPEYFCFTGAEPIESERIKFPLIPKGTWIQTVETLYSSSDINDNELRVLMSYLKDSLCESLTIHDLETHLNLPVVLIENLTFALLDNSKIPQKDVTMDDLLKAHRKPEPPSSPRPTQRKYRFLDQKQDFQPTPLNANLHKKSPQLLGNPKRELLSDNRKEAKARSITPIGLAKSKATPRRRIRTPLSKK